MSRQNSTTRTNLVRELPLPLRREPQSGYRQGGADELRGGASRRRGADRGRQSRGALPEQPRAVRGRDRRDLADLVRGREAARHDRPGVGIGHPGQPEEHREHGGRRPARRRDPPRPRRTLRKESRSSSGASAAAIPAARTSSSAMARSGSSRPASASRSTSTWPTGPTVKSSMPTSIERRSCTAPWVSPTQQDGSNRDETSGRFHPDRAARGDGHHLHPHRHPAADCWALAGGVEAESQCVNNLKQVMLALHGYIATHNTLPQGCTSETRPVQSVVEGAGLSWIVAILPHMEQNSDLSDDRLPAGSEPGRELHGGGGADQLAPLPDRRLVRLERVGRGDHALREDRAGKDQLRGLPSRGRGADRLPTTTGCFT